MPKMKTKRSAAKRFRKTGTGKVSRMKAFKSHKLSGKSRKRKRNLKKRTIIRETEENRVRVALPYLKKMH